MSLKDSRLTNDKVMLCECANTQGTDEDGRRGTNLNNTLFIIMVGNQFDMFGNDLRKKLLDPQR